MRRFDDTLSRGSVAVRFVFPSRVGILSATAYAVCGERNIRFRLSQFYQSGAYVARKAPFVADRNKRGRKTGRARIGQITPRSLFFLTKTRENLHFRWSNFCEKRRIFLVFFFVVKFSFKSSSSAVIRQLRFLRLGYARGIILSKYKIKEIFIL